MLTRRRHLTLFAVIVLVVAGSFLGAALEVEGAHHQEEVHHCVTCCTTHHTATAPAPIPLAVGQPAMPLAFFTTSDPYDKIVVRQLDPPPKFLA